MGALTLADARHRLTALTDPPTGDLTALSAEVLNEGLYASPKINKPDFRLTPTGSDTVADQPMDTEGNATTWGNSNYEGLMTVLRFLDADGYPDEADILWTMVRTKGTHLWLADRIGPKAKQPWAEGDPYRLFWVVTDNPQDPSDRAGYVKHTIPLGVQHAELEGVVAA